MPEEVLRHALDPFIWYGGHAVTATFFGVVFLMSSKPSGVWSVVVLVITAVLGIATARPFLRAPSRHRVIAG